MVRWDAPIACPSEQAVNAEVEAFVAEPDALRPDAYSAVVSRARGRYRAVVREPDTPPREFSDPSCDTVAEAVALYVAVNADEAARAPSNPTSEPSRVGLAVGWAFGGEVGVLPRITAGMRPSVALSVGSFAVEAYGDYWIPRRVQSDRVSARIDAGMAGINLCWVPAWGRWELPLCAGAEAGGVRAVGRGLDRTGATLRPWAAAVGSARARVRLAPRLALVAGPQLAASLVRPAFTATSVDGAVLDLHASRPVSVRAHVGFEFRIVR